MTDTVLVRSAEELAVAERRAEALDDLARNAGWRNLVMAIAMGIDTPRPLAGAVGSRINGEKRLAAAFVAPKESAP